MAFHPYPQVIPAVCKRHGFGPPRACSARFTLPMGSSPGFGSTDRDSCVPVAGHATPFRTRCRYGSACPWLSLAARVHSSAHSTKGTPSQGCPCSDRPEAHGFRISFTPLTGVLFTVPSRYWCTIGRWRYLALGRGRPCFPPDVACPAVLTIWAHAAAAPVAYRTLTLCGDPFQRSSAASSVSGEETAVPSKMPVQPPASIAGRL